MTGPELWAEKCQALPELDENTAGGPWWELAKEFFRHHYGEDLDELVYGDEAAGTEKHTFGDALTAIGRAFVSMAPLFAKVAKFGGKGPTDTVG